MEDPKPCQAGLNAGVLVEEGNLNKSKLARAIDCTRATLDAVLEGKNCHYKWLHPLAECLGMTYEELAVDHLLRKLPADEQAHFRKRLFSEKG